VRARQDGKTPLDLAESEGKAAVAALLREVSARTRGRFFGAAARPVRRARGARARAGAGLRRGAERRGWGAHGQWRSNEGAAAWVALERLAARAREVRAARDGAGGSSAAEVLREVVGFEALLGELRGGPPQLGAAAGVAAACAAAEERQRESRAAVQRAQGEVRRCAQAGAGGDALAAAVQQRDEQRAAHVEALRAALATLMRDAARAVGHDVWDEESVGGKRKPLKKQKSIVKKTKFESRGASGAPAAAGDADAAAAAEAEAEAMAAAAAEAAERVERALGAAAECAARYVAAHGGARQMGSSAAGDAGPAGAAGLGALCEAAVVGYDGWAGSVGVDKAKHETEEALKAVQKAAREALPGLFARGAAADGKAAKAVRAALVRSGRALAAEEAAQGRDGLADMPCGELLRAGRALVEERGAVAVAAARANATATDVCRELAGLEAVMDATGEQRTRRDGLEAEIRQADDAVMDARIKLKEIEVREMKLMRSKRATSVAEEIAAQQAAAGAELRAALAAKDRAIDALAAIEPDFPEVLPGDSPGPPAADSVPPGARTLGREG